MKKIILLACFVSFVSPVIALGETANTAKPVLEKTNAIKISPKAQKEIDDYKKFNDDLKKKRKDAFNALSIEAKEELKTQNKLKRAKYKAKKAKFAEKNNVKDESKDKLKAKYLGE